MKSFNLSVGIMAYNEEANLGKLLSALLSQDLKSGDFAEIVVVASGCTDKTEEIVKEYSLKDARIKLLSQPSREGKASAINYWLSRVPEEIDICVMESADTLPRKDTVEKLVAPFVQPSIGMTGTRPVPTNNPETFMGFVAHLVWGLHHRIALKFPKMGEMVAFRNQVKAIPFETPVDEVSLEAVIRKLGLKLLYVPDAVVSNCGPENLRDFLKQRRRIYAGHLYMKGSLNYAPPTMKGRLVLKELLSLIQFSPKKLLWTAGAIWLEVIARVLGMYDFYFKKKIPYKWEIAHSTKELKNV